MAHLKKLFKQVDKSFKVQKCQALSKWSTTAQPINVKNDLYSIGYWGLNSKPLDHQSLSVTNRPGLRTISYLSLYQQFGQFL